MLFKQTLVESAESVKHIAANMYIMLYTCSLEFLHASGGTGYNKLSTAVEILECFGSECSVFVIA